MTHMSSDIWINAPKEHVWDIIADLAQDKRMIGAYTRGEDLHAVTAAELLGIKLQDFDLGNPDHQQARQRAKGVNFGISFGCAGPGLQEVRRSAETRDGQGRPSLRQNDQPFC